MNQNQHSSILILSLAVVFLIGGCGSSEESEETSDNSVTIEPTMQDNINDQNQLESEATSSLSNSTIEDNFEFSTQKTVMVDIQFTNTVYNERIAIYAEMDFNSNTPIYLLEQTTLKQSSSYQTIISVAATLSSLIIVKNDDLSDFTEVTINNYGQLTYTF